ncbi:unnamed protein product [Prorocentrum cordatum]|uniref:Cellulase n=1 Tax=Prorocentrum cordatum TaxID=2364126 RepID=A0ABN9Q6M3_9DINO|nr:unnamed protein product [Polarella glacialis]
MWMEDRWVKTNETVWDCGVIAIESTDNATDAADTDAPADSASSSDASTASACSQNGESCAQTMCCSEPGAKCYKKNDHWSSCNQTCDPLSLWEVDRWVVTNETVWDCEEVRPPCTPNGASCALSQCCSEPGAKCYKKNDYWSSCNQTCNPNYLWMETIIGARAIKLATQTTCGWRPAGSRRTRQFGTARSSLSIVPMFRLPPIRLTPRAAPMPRHPPCVRQTGSLVHLPSAALRLARSATRKMAIGVRATNLATQTPCGRWTAGSRRTRQSGTARKSVSRARLTGRLAHFPSAAPILTRSATRSHFGSSQFCPGPDSGAPARQAPAVVRSFAAMRADRSPFLPLQLPLESDCEPGEVAPARALRAPRAQRARAAAAALSAAAAALALLAMAWRAGPSTGAATLASPEAIIVEAASADANESADPDESDPCSQTGASCAVSKCCSEPGSKCYKKNDYWFACNQTCNPYYMWKDGGWVKTNETVWDCEEIRPPCTPNGESCALSKCCSEPGMKCYKKNDYWSSCNQTCNPNYLWMETGWVKTDDTHWDCEVITIDSTDYRCFDCLRYD